MVHLLLAVIYLSYRKECSRRNHSAKHRNHHTEPSGVEDIIKLLYAHARVIIIRCTHRKRFTYCFGYHGVTRTVFYHRFKRCYTTIDAHL